MCTRGVGFPYNILVAVAAVSHFGAEDNETAIESESPRFRRLVLRRSPSQ